MLYIVLLICENLVLNSLSLKKQQYEKKEHLAPLVFNYLTSLCRAIFTIQYGFNKCQFDFRNQLCFTLIQNRVIANCEV